MSRVHESAPRPRGVSCSLQQQQHSADRGATCRATGARRGLVASFWRRRESWCSRFLTRRASSATRRVCAVLSPMAAARTCATSLGVCVCCHERACRCLSVCVCVSVKERVCFRARAVCACVCWCWMRSRRQLVPHTWDLICVMASMLNSAKTGLMHSLRLLMSSFQGLCGVPGYATSLSLSVPATALPVSVVSQSSP